MNTCVFAPLFLLTSEHILYSVILHYCSLIAFYSIRNIWSGLFYFIQQVQEKIDGWMESFLICSESESF